ncbi:MAG: TrbC/VirB2 family protein [Ferrimonas sp.]
MKLFFSLFFSFLILVAFDASAAVGTGMPWDSPLEKIMQSITGPVAVIISLIAIVAAMVTLAFGGEISGVFKSLIYLALLIAVLVGAANLLSSLFGVSGAVVTATEIAATCPN